ncbi:Avr1b-1 Avirulence-like protein [Phytophthora palmivora]|uniref:Avr1b-1 Avirulence-like protein n=1 Tax=Phytophthora palmivora TaxID=4796 RepID=A0A2P4X9N5_9STRA|nr:Avr1b-1 Avirulence-like protein [Phytophthora palmivora]
MIPKSEVKAKLGLVGLSTEAARMDPNHQFYGMNIPTADVWSYMGLEKASKDLKTMKASFAYMFFTRYVQRVDDEGVLLHQAGKSLPSTMNKPVTSAEMSAKAEIWASTKRTKAYVKWALGLGNLKGEELKTNVAYKYYLQYLKARKVKFEN